MTDHHTTSFIGIDPGTNGGIAVLRGITVTVYKMPEDEELAVLLREIVTKHSKVFIELIPRFCGQKRYENQKIMGSDMAVLYGNMQLARGIMLGMGFEVTRLAPLKWQNSVGCRNHEGLDKPAWKNKLKAHAQELFPDFNKVTLWSADALLIAHAGRSLAASA